jgi:hypothetical protein
MGKLYYFQAPNFNINPDSEIAPKLGSIFSNLETPVAPLNKNEYVSVPQNLMNQSVSADFEETVSQNIMTGVGLTASVAQKTLKSRNVVYAFAKDQTVSCSKRSSAKLQRSLCLSASSPRCVCKTSLRTAYLGGRECT